jgi:tetratricopeptide (TPR) repeat protein
MPARLFLSSGDLIADRRYDFARDLQLRGDLPAAADLLQQAVELAPNFASAWFTLGEIRKALGERDAAIEAFRKARDADPQDRHGASVHLMQLGAEPLSAMPASYVQSLFDQYAPRFENALLNDLGYRAPSLLLKAVLSVRNRVSRKVELQINRRSRSVARHTRRARSWPATWAAPRIRRRRLRRTRSSATSTT